MDKSELIAEFKNQLAQFVKYQTFIDKARSYAERFNPAVVEKVIADNTLKIQEVATVLDPLVGDLRRFIAGLEADREGTVLRVDEARMKLEELDLRQAIGEIDADQHRAQGEGYRAELAAAEDGLAYLDLELADFRSTLDTWLTNRPEGADSGEVALDDAEDDDAVELESDQEAEQDDDLLGFEDEARGPGEHIVASAGLVADDVSAVFEGQTHDDAPLEADDGGIQFTGSELADLKDDLLADGQHAQGDTQSDGEAKAVLVLAEGTQEEHAFAFVADAISVGRGRDNNIQVKNDSKVSRYHCRVFRKAGSYYIVDNKSANGTLVDGELITEKRLFGGEEIIVGETPFRFRIER